MLIIKKSDKNIWGAFSENNGWCKKTVVTIGFRTLFYIRISTNSFWAPEKNVLSLPWKYRSSNNYYLKSWFQYQMRIFESFFQKLFYLFCSTSYYQSPTWNFSNPTRKQTNTELFAMRSTLQYSNYGTANMG